MSRSRISTLLTTTLLTGSIAACATDLDMVAAPGESIDDYIRALPYLPADPAQVEEGDRSAAAEEGDYSCTSQNLSETRQYDKIVAYGANSESLWPGALVGADSVYSGLFTQMVFDRNPMTFSVGMENLAGRKSAVMEAPSLSSYRDQLTNILDAEVIGSTPANIYSEIEQVHSSEQLSLALGVDVSWGGTGSISASFDWNQQDVRSRYLVRFTQSYYTVDVDQPRSPADVFAPSVGLDDVKEQIDEYNPPLYVSSITYGRMVVFTFESEYSSEEMNAALEFAYSAGVNVSGSVSVSYEEMISSSKITAFILGGSGAAAVQTIDSYEALMDFIRSGGDYSRESPGAPIAYKLANLKDNSSARMSFTTDYTVKDCVRVGQEVLVTLKNLTVESDGGDAGNDLEIYGDIWVESDEMSIPLWSRGSDYAVTIAEGNTYPQAYNLAQDILRVRPQPGSAVSLHANLWDADGFLNPNDHLGNITLDAVFEAGWRRDVQLLLTGDSARVVVTFGLTPI
ncbi:MAG: thiol-activated cytolysin family protein [Kofleriaceae bacterium]